MLTDAAAPALPADPDPRRWTSDEIVRQVLPAMLEDRQWRAVDGALRLLDDRDPLRAQAVIDAMVIGLVLLEGVAA